MNAQISPDEQQQILQTIEMFEVITQSNPNDTQSLEILKEAYSKLGRVEDALVVTRKLADTYKTIGQYSSAVLEYESLLQQQPGNPEIITILGELETMMAASTRGSRGGGIDLDFGDLLIATGQTQMDVGGTTFMKFAVPENDGNDALARFIIQHKLAPEELVRSSLDRIQNINKNLTGEALAASLIEEIAKNDMVDINTLLNGILDRTKFAYIPLEYYDVDRQIVKMVPEALTLKRLIVPFDLVSRTVMIAMANPFDALGKDAVQQLLDYNIQWHLASPSAISNVLTTIYRLNERD